MKSEESLSDWQYLEKELLPTLADFENPEEVTEYVTVKIKSILTAAKDPGKLSNTAIPASTMAGVQAISLEDAESMPYKSASDRFHRYFPACHDEKLVSYYSCSWLKSSLPSQGWMYLTESHLAFYSFIFGKESKLLLRWIDVTKVEKTRHYIAPDKLKISTRESDHYFGMFLNRAHEAYDNIRQLADLAMRKLMDDDSKGISSLGNDLNLLLKSAKNVPKTSSFLKRDLNARQVSEEFRLKFQMPNDEKMDGQVECYLWTPYNKKYRFGKLYLSQNFACFSSHVPGLVLLVIPLRDVSKVENAESCPNGNTIDQALKFTMRNQYVGAVGKEFIFANVHDQKFVIEKIAELLAGTREPQDAMICASGDHGATANECENFELCPPLMNTFKETVMKIGSQHFCRGKSTNMSSVEF